VTAKDKAALMAVMRKRREKEGMVQLNVWVKREHVERVRRYIARLSSSSSAEQPK
jgi:hypothetical protein